MRSLGCLIGAALLVSSAAFGAELKAGPLFAICSKADKPAALGCQAFTEGFVLGLAGAGAICPPPDAYKEVIKDLLGLPREEIGSKSVAELMVPRLKARYGCSGA